jgi:arylsulfatase A-like enzyme
MMHHFTKTGSGQT